MKQRSRPTATSGILDVTLFASLGLTKKREEDFYEKLFNLCEMCWKYRYVGMS